MSKNKQILLALLKGGSSQDAIAATLHVSKRDVSAAAKAVSNHGLGFADVMAMDAAAIDDTFFPKRQAGRKKDDAYLQPDMEDLIERKKRNRKLPVKLMWGEYCDMAASAGMAAYSYQTFCDMFAKEAETTGAARHFAHVAGEKAYIDWAGDAAKLTDRVTGKITKVYVLVVALPHSAFFWAGGFTDMKQASWLDGQMEAFEAFGGTPRMLIPDNCATATDRGSAYVTLVNKDYGRFAEHYGAAVMPARIRAPRDKGLAESTVNLVEEWVIAPSNELIFYTLDEFNEYCAERVAWLNDRPFSDKEGSRREAFLDREAEELLPLPAERFELCEWRRCKVAPNYHVRIDYMHYSVPHALIGRTVDARVSAGKVCIFDGGDLVAEHARLFGRKNQYSTVVEHMPANHKEVESPWSPDRFTSWAAKIGPETEVAIRAVLASRPVVEQAFVPCRNMLGLAKQYGPRYLERACARSNELAAVPSYTGLKNAILAIRDAERHDRAANPSAAKSARPRVVDNAKSAGRLRGADAYRRTKGGEAAC